MQLALVAETRAGALGAAQHSLRGDCCKLSLPQASQESDNGALCLGAQASPRGWELPRLWERVVVAARQQKKCWTCRHMLDMPAHGHGNFEIDFWDVSHVNGK